MKTSGVLPRLWPTAAWNRRSPQRHAALNSGRCCFLREFMAVGKQNGERRERQFNLDWVAEDSRVARDVGVCVRANCQCEGKRQMHKLISFDLAIVALILGLPSKAQEQGITRPQLFLRETIQGMPKGETQRYAPSRRASSRATRRCSIRTVARCLSKSFAKITSRARAAFIISERLSNLPACRT
jgi:hypothetical protein